MMSKPPYGLVIGTVPFETFHLSCTIFYTHYRIASGKQLTPWIMWYTCTWGEVLLIPDQNVPGHDTKCLPSHDGKGLLQLPLVRHVIFWGPTRWYPALHTKVTLLLYVLPVEMASAFSTEGCSPQVIPIREEKILVLYKQQSPFCLAGIHCLQFYSQTELKERWEERICEVLHEKGYVMPCSLSLLGFRLQTPERDPALVYLTVL